MAQKEEFKCREKSIKSIKLYIGVLLCGWKDSHAQINYINWIISKCSIHDLFTHWALQYIKYCGWNIKLKRPVFKLSSDCAISYPQSNNSNARQNIKSPPVSHIYEMLDILYTHRVFWRSIWLQIGTVSHKVPPYQPLFIATVTEVVLWLRHAGLCVGEFACLVVFCEGECHVASKMGYFPSQVSQETNASSIMTRDSIHASKGQACACGICRQCWGNWLQNNVWCRGNL